MPLHFVDDGLGDVAFVESPRTFVGDAPQYGGQLNIGNVYVTVSPLSKLRLEVGGRCENQLSSGYSVR